MRRHRGPAWGALSMLVPLMGGLFMVEYRASLPPGWHTGLQVGIVLLIYGLVWLWLRANALRLIWSDQLTGDGERAIGAHGALISSSGARFNPRQAAYIIEIRVRHRHRRVQPQGKGRGIRKCSLNFDRRSS